MLKTPSVHKMKVVFIGTLGAGKSYLANLIADATDNNDEYRPTVGVRILEFESQINIQNKTMITEVELWDCSGNRRYEPYWAAFRQDSLGVVLVTDPAQGSQLELTSQLEMYYDYFVRQSGLSPAHCLIMVTTQQNVPLGKMPQLLSNVRVQQVSVDLDDGGKKLKTDFSNFLRSMLNNSRPDTERESISSVGV